jgi:hypothetical protein
MTPVATKVDRNPIRSGLFTDHCRSNHTGFRRASRLTHRGDVIDVDVKASSHLVVKYISQI